MACIGNVPQCVIQKINIGDTNRITPVNQIATEGQFEQRLLRETKIGSFFKQPAGKFWIKH